MKLFIKFYAHIVPLFNSAVSEYLDNVMNCKTLPIHNMCFRWHAVAWKSQWNIAGEYFVAKLGRIWKMAKMVHTKITYWNIIFINLYGKLFCWWKICKFFNTTFTIFLPFTRTTLWQVIGGNGRIQFAILPANVVYQF